MKHGLWLLLLAMVASCAGGPGKPGEAPAYQPQGPQSMDYIYRSPPPDVARALR